MPKASFSPFDALFERSITRIHRHVELNLSSTWVELEFNFTAKVRLRSNLMLTAESIDNYFQSRTQSSTQLSRTQGRARYTSTFTVEVRLKLYLSLTLNARFVSWCNEFYKLNQKKAKFYTKSCTIRQFTINTSNITEWVHVFSGIDHSNAASDVWRLCYLLFSIKIMDYLDIHC